MGGLSSWVWDQSDLQIQFASLLPANRIKFVQNKAFFETMTKMFGTTLTYARIGKLVKGTIH